MQTDRKKILIVKPPYRHMPVGMAYVLSCLERHHISFDFIDTLLTRPDYSRLLKRDDYLAFAVGGLVGDFNFISQTVKTVRSIRPDLPVILGGNITKDANQEFLFDKKLMGIDFGVIGEAETSLPCLIDKLSIGDTDFEKVPGLLFKNRESGEIIKNHPKRLDLERVNILPAWHYINVGFYKYSRVSYMANQKVIPVLTGRGCVGSCTFCSPTIGAFQKRPLEHIMEEIEFIFSKYNFDILHILNEVFYQTKEDILQFCERYKKLKTRKPWMCGMRVDVEDIDESVFTAMKEAGCILAGIGIESGSNKVLRMMRKRITKDQIINFCRGAKKARLPYFGTFMIGNEGEDEDDIKETIDMVISEEMNTDASLTNAYPGTQIYRNILNAGLAGDEREYYKNVHCIPAPYDLSFENQKRYLNVSGIPDGRFWSVIFSELRRFYTFSFNRFRVLNVKYRISYLTNTIKASGICSECGASVRIFSVFNLLGQQVYCPRCYHCLYLNYYAFKKFSKHFEMLRNELKRAEKLVIIGTGHQAMNMLHYDHFGLDYEKMKGFVSFEKKSSELSLFAYMPKLQLCDLLDIMPDAVLIADDPRGDAESKLKMFYLENNLRFSNILYLVPDREIWVKVSKLKTMLKRIFGAGFVRKIGLFCMRDTL